MFSLKRERVGGNLITLSSHGKDNRNLKGILNLGERFNKTLMARS